MPPSNTNDAVKLGEEEIPCTNTFKYLGSIFAAEGGTEADCKNRVRLSWNKWRETTGVICDKKVPVKLIVKIYQTVIKPTMLYGAECWAMRKKEEHLLNKTEMRMLRWIQGISLKDHVRSEEIRNRLNVMAIVDQVTKRRLSWYGHIKRRKPEDVTRTVLDMEIPGKRPRGRPRIRWMDNIRRDMILHGLDDKMTEDRKVWSTMVAKVDTRSVQDPR